MEFMNYNVPNILIVDDINANLVVLTEMVRSIGYIARPVTSAYQAQKAIENLKPHLILLDVSMPEMDGFELCKAIKNHPNTRDIPIIFISALGNKEDKVRGFQLGAVDYISKPFEVEEVILRINTHIKIYKMQQQLELCNKKLYQIINEQVRSIYNEQKTTVLTLLKLFKYRNPKLQAHLERVGVNSRLLAISMEISMLYEGVITKGFIESIEYAAQLHDIGKFAIDPVILDKVDCSNQSLTEEEQLAYEQHISLGAETIKQVFASNEYSEFAKLSREITLNHHEHWDGSGFPKGLKQDQIPLSARIVSIVDAYDVYMMYHEACGENKQEACKIAMEQVIKEKGVKFDPDIVAIFLRIQKQLMKI